MKRYTAITISLLLIVTMMFSQSVQAEGITDTVGGHVAGGKASVALVALLVDGTNTLRPIVVTRKETSGAVSFNVTRQVGFDMAARAGGWRWRGWGLVVEGMDCVNLELRQGAKMLRSRCEAGIIAGDWAGAISAADMATFSVAAIQPRPSRAGNNGNSGNGAGRGGQQPPAPAGATNPPAMPPAANSPVMPPSTPTPIATGTPRPTASLRPTDTPRPTNTPSPQPTSTPTLVPIIKEQPATIVMPVVTALPTATATPQISESAGEILATPPLAASVDDTAPHQKTGGIDLVTTVLQLLGFIVLVFGGWLGSRWLKARQMDKRATGWAELPTAPNDIAEQRG